MQDEVAEIVGGIVAECAGGVRDVAWVAAGGSMGGFWPGHWFLEHEAHGIRTHLCTSNEFVMATPLFVGPGTVVVVCSMRGTPETCEAARVAKGRGAVTVGLYVQESDLTTICDHMIAYESIALDESRTERVNSTIALCLAIELLQQTEGYPHHGEAMKAFDKVDSIYHQALIDVGPRAREWAERNRDAGCIYVMASGPALGSAYIFSICNLEEMLQVASPTIDSCEFFHGPFEVLDQTTSLFMLVSVGHTRAADERALRFLRRYGGKGVHVLDGRELGVSDLPDSVSEYFNHVLFSPVLNNVYLRALSEVRHKEYHTRRYMWKVEY